MSIDLLLDRINILEKRGVNPYDYLKVNNKPYTRSEKEDVLKYMIDYKKNLFSYNKNGK